ncbi:MAG: acyl-CoA thioesterase [Xanthobacteraceae bacterium]|nr:acyl-CoA thioesterase [Xanthobacteraceae bacterium]
MNAPSRIQSAPRLENYPLRLADNVRFGDLDVNGHVNNAVYASYFETGRVILVRDPARGLTPPGAAWVMVRLDTHFRAELHWPGTIETGLGVLRLGNSSVLFEQVVFSEGRCVASAHATTVMIDAKTRKPIPLSPEVRANFKPWMMRDAAAPA